MSSAFYPLGMNSYNNRLHTGGYETWKGRGVYGNPVGITSGSMRPLTNKDPANDAVYKFNSSVPDSAMTWANDCPEIYKLSA